MSTMTNPTPRILKQEAVTLARGLGACAAGIARPNHLEGWPDILQSWLQRKNPTAMTYMDRTAALRTEVTRWWSKTRSIVCVAVPYPLPPERPPDARCGRIAGYALGTDYHLVVADLLQTVASHLRSITNHSFDYRIAVDSKPLPERALAVASGLGAIGRHGQLIVPGWGSAVVLGELILPFDLPPDAPLAWDPCKNCDRCVAACPTQAIDGTGSVDPMRCLSYWTTDQRGPIPAEVVENMGGRLAGCDTCQIVCPHNQKRIGRESDQECQSAPHWHGNSPWLDLPSLFGLGGKALARLLSGTALERTGPAGLWRNALAAAWTGPARDEVLSLSEKKNSPLVEKQRAILHSESDQADRM